ncbi:hypothetical protein DDZ18_06535 [Marinicauda salina]|uniref:Peptidase inhibitor I78 family protein n=1 Tax=Marinicauda salina TaxID=2135793 RepID=A0A2U2BTL0_9PROT|nr:I78 family peptidase inhibitor [Marinicauda salina]PWE17338.1 hypothetical protein DDZ18_06535 [Marinicauda salina]
MTLRILIAAVAGLALGGCAGWPMTGSKDGEPEPAPIVDRTGDVGGGEAAPPSCAAERYQVLVGQLRAEIDEASLPHPLRVYNRGDMVTQDYRPDRLNLVVGADGRIVEVYCG